MRLSTQQSNKSNKTLRNTTNHQSANILQTLEGEINYEELEKEVMLESMNLTQKLPGISHVINMRFKADDKDQYNQILDIIKYSQKLENIVKYKNKEIERLKYMIKYLTMAQQKRDEMLSHIQEENRKLKESNIMFEGLSKSMTQSFLDPKNAPQSIKKLLQPGTELSTAISPKKSIKQMDLENGISPFARSPTKKKPRIKNIMQMDDRPFTVLTSDLNSDLSQQYQNKEFIQLFQKQCSDEDEFVKYLQNQDYLGNIHLFDNIQKVLNEHKSLFFLVFRLRKLIKAALQMGNQMVIMDALEVIVHQTCDILETDRASVFIFDQEKEQLWTKVAKGSKKTISVPYNQGIVGHVFTKAETLNILNAYNDSRFNREVDKQTHYKTNTILCAPIFDKDNGSVIGVLQCINKIKGYFTKDDEGLMGIICEQAGIVLRNSQQFDETIFCGINLSSDLVLEDLILRADKRLKELFLVQKSKILIVDTLRSEFLTFNEFKQPQRMNWSIGIAGHVLKTGVQQNIANCYNHELFNNQIDIDTSCPILVCPVKMPSDNTQIIAVIEIINQRGIAGMATTKKSSLNILDQEALEFFCQQLAQYIQNAKNYTNMKEQFEKQQQMQKQQNQ